MIKPPYMVRSNPKWIELLGEIDVEVDAILRNRTKDVSEFYLLAGKSAHQLNEIREEVGSLTPLTLFEELESAKEFIYRDIKSHAYLNKLRGSYLYFKTILKKAGLKGEYRLLFRDENNNYVKFYPNLNDTAAVATQSSFIVPEPFFPDSESFVATYKLDTPVQALDDDSFVIDDSLVPLNLSPTNSTLLEIDVRNLSTFKSNGLLPYGQILGEVGRGSSEFLRTGFSLNYVKMIGSNLDVSQVNPNANLTVNHINATSSLSNLTVTFTHTPLNQAPVEFRYVKQIPDHEKYYQTFGTRNYTVLNSFIPLSRMNDSHGVSYAGDGTSVDFPGQSFLAPVRPLTLRIQYFSDGVKYTAKDDGKGRIIGEKSQGTINYETGEIDFFTKLSGLGPAYESPIDNGTSAVVTVELLIRGGVSRVECEAFTFDFNSDNYLSRYAHDTFFSVLSLTERS